LTWFGVALAVGTLDRCLREVGVACEPIVEDLLEEVRASGVIHADEGGKACSGAGCGWC
jgi:transposase